MSLLIVSFSFLLNTFRLPIVNLSHQNAYHKTILGRYPYRNGYLRHFIFACRLEEYRKTLYSDDYVRVVFLTRA